MDCGDVERIISSIPKDAKIKGVFLTHTHFDHIYGLNKLIEYFPNCVIYTNKQGKEGLFSDKLNFSRYHSESFIFRGNHIELLEDGDEIFLSPSVVLKVLFTPGHDWSCISYYTDKMIFTGDSYIPSTKLITSFPKSNKEEATVSLNRIMGISKNRDVYPGHGEIMKRN